MPIDDIERLNGFLDRAQEKVFREYDIDLDRLIERERRRMQEAAEKLGEVWNGKFNDGNIKVIVMAYLEMRYGRT